MGKIKSDIEETINSIKKRFGEGSIMKFGEITKSNVDAIPTGCLSLDLALGIGGIPRGRIIEIYGNESSGKTTLALHIIAEAQKRGGTCAFIDAEHSLDPAYSANIGVDIEALLISQPDSGEEALEIAETLVRSKKISVVVIDSVSALVPQKEIEGDMGSQHMGLQARLMSQALRKLTAIVSKTNTTIIFINQIRNKIGMFFGSPETTSGGNALKFYSSVRIEVRKAGQLLQGENNIGNRVKAKIVKNKVAPPFKVCIFDIIYGKGISRAGDLLNLGLENKLIEKNGNSYSFGDIKLGVGRENTRRFIDENLLDELDKNIRNKLI